MIVTRFAPSPTGYLHIGGARTALFCYLLARRHNGKMILRIEDTDQKRNTPTATQQVIDDLRWLGIQWDEGPDCGGPGGPYLQSQRRDIYDKYIAKLLESGHAYYCFDTTEELDSLRTDAQTQKKTFLYRRPENFPTAAEVAAARSQGRPVVIRFAMPDEPIVVTDIVRGTVTFPAGEFGDFIIQKSDGFPTYHFACVVDDELMGVTHVIRGQEHLMNTPGHLALQRALGFKTPIYAHISVTVSAGGGKLSKRDRAKTLLKTIKSTPDIDLQKLATAGGISAEQLNEFLDGTSSPDAPNISAMAEHLNIQLPEINVVDFCKSGYIPEAMLNFVALLGWSPGDDREVMTLDELIAAFDIERLIKSNSLFDRQKLSALNTEHMRMIAPEKLLQHFKKYLQVNNSPILNQADDQMLTAILKACAGARNLADIVQKVAFLFTNQITFDQKAVEKVLKKDGISHLLTQIRDNLTQLDPFNEDSIMEMIQKMCEKDNLQMGKIAQPIRVAITGTTISPGIAESLVLLGKEKTIQRIDHTIKALQNNDI